VLLSSWLFLYDTACLSLKSAHFRVYHRILYYPLQVVIRFLRYSSAHWLAYWLLVHVLGPRSFFGYGVLIGFTKFYRISVLFLGTLEAYSTPVVYGSVQAYDKKAHAFLATKSRLATPLIDRVSFHDASM